MLPTFPLWKTVLILPDARCIACWQVTAETLPGISWAQGSCLIQSTTPSWGHPIPKVRLVQSTKAFASDQTYQLPSLHWNRLSPLLQLQHSSTPPPAPLPPNPASLIPLEVETGPNKPPADKSPSPEEMLFHNNGV